MAEEKKKFKATVQFDNYGRDSWTVYTSAPREQKTEKTLRSACEWVLYWAIEAGAPVIEITIQRPA